MGALVRCARVRVPLDPSGKFPGRLRLFIERVSLTPHPHGTVVALAGGPGQSAISLMPSFVHDLDPLLKTRALILFDVRGVGRSSRLSCSAGGSLRRCVRRLGPRARFFSTFDTVADMEAVRRALHIARWEIYGASYGTFPALQYARRYPARVDHLVLDSTVPLDYEPAVDLTGVAAIRALLSSMCTSACGGLDPLKDVESLFDQAGTAGVSVPATAGPVLLTAEDLRLLLYGLMFDTDLDPLLRASVPAALHLAAGGDRSALTRLASLQSVGMAWEFQGASSTGNTTDVEPIATDCEDTRLPWSASDPLGVRLAKARRVEFGLSPAWLAPFSGQTVMAASPIAECLRWPYSGDRPPRVAGGLPRVPTLVLSGDNDIRTPRANAEAVANAIKGAVLLRVPDDGHAVIATDRSGCGVGALVAFTTGKHVTSCGTQPHEWVDPLPPASIGLLAPALPLNGVPGEALDAAVLTLRHDVGFALESGPLPEPISGTEGGAVHPAADGVVLRGVVYIQGVALNGRLTFAKPYVTGRITVSLAGNAYGTLILDKDGSVSGTLGGQEFALSAQAREALVQQGGLDPTP